MYTSALELAFTMKLETSIIHHDVIGAGPGQPFTPATKPFKANPDWPTEPSSTPVDYDLGRNGFAYFDTDTADYPYFPETGIRKSRRFAPIVMMGLTSALFSRI